MGSLHCMICGKTAGKVLRFQLVAGGEAHLLREAVQVSVSCRDRCPSRVLEQDRAVGT
jgi:hypothetical protein